MGYQERIAALPPVQITSTPGVVGGRPFFEGTRIPVEAVIACIEGGDSAFDIYGAYPSLRVGSIAAVIVWAGAQGRDISLSVRRMPD